MLRSFMTVCVLSLASAVAHSAVISVFSDIDMFGGGHNFPVGNQRVALNVLGSGHNVFMSSKGGEDADDLYGFYNSQAGLSVLRSSAALASSLLVGVDLLVIDIGFNMATSYSASETTAISNFLYQGGNVMLIAEGDPSVSTYNSLLSAIGSSISYESGNRCCPGIHNPELIIPTYITAGVSQFELGAANNLLGGVAAIRDGGFTVAAYEVISNNAVPIPPAVWLFASALGVMGVMRRKIAS